MPKKLLTFLLLLFPYVGIATELWPWFGNNFELESRANYLFQTFSVLDRAGKDRPYASKDSFLTLSLGSSVDESVLALLDWPLGSLAAELELTFADTRHRSFGVDNWRLTIRQQWLDDIDLDPISLVTGFTLTQAFTQSLRDPGSFHHGRIEFEIHAALGKETGCNESWNSRWWGIFGIGIANKGAPWLRADFSWEKKLEEELQLSLSVRSLWGLGHRKLSFPFHGYGLINHRSIDLGIGCSYFFDIWGSLTFEYAKRVYAFNFPKWANLLVVRYDFPFGL